MIAVATLDELIRSRLDAIGSDRYLFDQDIKPAINSAIDISVAMFNAAFASNKLSPPVFTTFARCISIGCKSL